MKPITSLTKDFIERCVMPDEELRMGYREIFIIKKNFNQHATSLKPGGEVYY